MQRKKNRPNAKNQQNQEKTQWVKPLVYSITDIVQKRYGMKQESSNTSRINRRIAAISGTCDEAAIEIPKRVRGLTLSKGKAIRRNYVEVNSITPNNYDILNEHNRIWLGAAVYMIDLIILNGSYSKLLDIIRPYEELTAEIPVFRDASIPEPIIRRVVGLIIYRNARTTNAQIGVLDNYKPVRGNEMPYRAAYDAVIDLLPKNKIAAAQLDFREAFWDYLSIIFDCVKDQLSQSEQSSILNPTCFCQNSLKPVRENPMVLQSVGIKDYMDNVTIAKANIELLVNASMIPYCIDAELAHNICQERLNKFRQFKVADPYKACFAFLTLLDQNDDLPWLFTGSIGVLAAAWQILPWSMQVKDDQKYVDQFLGPQRNRDKLYETIQHDGFQNVPTQFAKIIYNAMGVVLPRYDFNGWIDQDSDDPMTELYDERFTAKDVQTVCNEAYSIFIMHKRIEDLDEWEEESSAESEDQSNLELNRRSAFLESQHLMDQETIQRYAHKTTKLTDELETLQGRNTEMESELAELRETVFQLSQPESIAPEPEKTIGKELRWPYEISDRIVIVGGHDSWSKAFRPMFKGNIRFIDRNTIPDASQIRNASAIWIQTNAMCHSAYWKTTDIARKEHIPIHYFSSASAENCARQIVDTIA